MNKNLEVNNNAELNEIKDDLDTLLLAVKNNERYNNLFKLAKWPEVKWAKVCKYVDKYWNEHLTTGINEWGIHKSYDLMRDADWYFYIKRAYLLKDWDPRAKKYKWDKEFVHLEKDSEASKYLKIFESRIK